MTDLIFSFPDQLEFDTLYEEVFKQHTYYVDLPTQTPRIIDAGANIGMSMLYFAKQYPQAQIICIEPNPKVLPYLEKNRDQNHLEHVEIIPKALVGKKGNDTAVLYTHPNWGVFASLKKGGWTGDDGYIPVPVQTIRLSEVIDLYCSNRSPISGSPDRQLGVEDDKKIVDLLKIDIEGMESEIIEEAQDRLRLVSHVLIEFHQTKTHTPEKILRILENYFGDITIEKDKRKEKKKTDQLLLISAS